MKTLSFTTIGLFLSLHSLSALSAVMEKKLFTLEKNFHADNVAVIFAQVDDDCHFAKIDKNGEKNFLDYYWMMGNGSRKEMHPLIRKEVKKRFQFLSATAAGDSFKVVMNDLTELKHDLPEKTAEIIAEVNAGKCEVRSIISLGASGNHRKLNLKKTFCEVTKNVLGVPTGCKFLDLSGVDADTGESLSVRFNKK